MSQERLTTASRNRKRSRPRQRKSIVSSQSTSSQKSQKQTQGEPWYSIKDIVGERIERGKLLYKVDWADDPVTGEVYDQTWIPAEDANEEAIEDWEEKKQRDTDNRRRISSTDSDSQPVRQRNRRSSIQEKGTRLQQFSGSSGNSGPKQAPGDSEEVPGSQVYPVELGDHTTGADLTVEINHKPSFDRTEYTLITSSQLDPDSQPHSDSQVQPVTPLPPCAPTQRSQQASQQVDTQWTIPDSQDYESSLPGGVVSVQPLSKFLGLSKTQPKPAGAGVFPPKDSSPAQHLQEQQVSQVDTSPSTTEENSSGAEPVQSQAIVSGEDPLPSGQHDNLSLQFPVTELPSTSGSLEFLTQAPFISESPVYNRNATPAQVVNSEFHQSSSLIPDSVQQRTTTSLSTSEGASAAAESASQAAQIVSPLESSQDELVIASQIPFDFDVYGDENLTPDVIPETTRKQGQQNDSQGSNSALSEVDNNVRRSFAQSPSRGIDSSPALVRRAATSSQESQYLTSSIEEDPVEDVVPPRRLRSPVTRQSRVVPTTPFFLSTRRSSDASTPVTPSQAVTDGTTSTPMSAVDELRRALELEPDYSPEDADVVSQSLPQELPEAHVVEPEASAAAILSNIEPDPALSLDNALVNEPTPVVDNALVIDPALAVRQMPMAEPTPDPTPQSAGDVLMEAFETAPAAPSVVEAPDVFSTTQVSAVDQLRQALEAPIEPAPATISPAALFNSMEVEPPSTMSVPMTDLQQTESLIAELLPTATSASSSPDVDDQLQSSLDGLLTPVASGPNEFVVTLPLAANVRPQYLDTVIEHRNAIETFTEAFTSDNAGVVPPQAVIASIDFMFKKLSDICDLPIYIESLPVMGEVEMMRHATNSNSKFSFVHELIESIRYLEKKVAIISQPGRVADFIEAIVATSGVRFRRLGEDAYARKSESDDPLTVTICTTGSDNPPLPADTDVVIAFDRDARASPLTAGQYFKQPIVLSLVATHTLEHLDMRISKKRMDPLERKNALVFSLVQARSLLEEPQRGMHEPHEAAQLFGSYIKDATDDFVWEPQPIDDEIFKVYLESSQQEAGTQQTNEGLHSQLEEAANSRKRRLDDNGAAQGSPKRVRMSESTEALPSQHTVHLSPALRELLGGHVKTDGSTVVISVDQLESLAAKIGDLESRLKDKEAIEQTHKTSIRDLEASNKSYIRSIRKMQPKYMDALRDRGTFEADHAKALKTAEGATAKSAAQASTIAALKAEKAAVEEKLAAATATLTTSSIPSIARLAQMEADLAAATKKCLDAENRLVQKNKELEYARDAYQQASNSASEALAENSELKARTKDLERRASKNILEVHAMNNKANAEHAQHLYLSVKATLAEREAELERVREEVRTRGNGRSTRQQSAGPRSPRVGVVHMSPAPPRRGAGAGAAGGTSSRGTSPIPSFGGQTGNGRWDHLRD